jgi:hypothetical protein
MHLHFDLVPPRYRAGPRRQRQRQATSHLRVLVVLPGRKRVHLAAIPLPCDHDSALRMRAKCRDRLDDLGTQQREMTRLLTSLEAGLLKRNIR